MSPKRKAANLANYWSGTHASVQGRLDAVRDYLRHPSSGISTEEYFRDLLRQYLPRRYSVETGFVVNTEGQKTDHIDVLLVDSHHIPPLSAEPHFKVFPAEAVVGGIEITSAPKAGVLRSGIKGKITKLEDDILKLARLRQLAKDREYIDSIAVANQGGIEFQTVTYRYSLSPRSFLITCGDEWAKSETYEKYLLAALNSAVERQEAAWLNAVFSMKHGMFHFKPHTKFEHERIKENPLLEFFFFINNAISDFRVSRIDMRRYMPRVPAESQEQRENERTERRPS